MITTMKSGKYTILGSGTIMTFDIDSDACLELKADGKKLFTLIFTFDSKDSNREQGLWIRSDVANRNIEISCINLDNLLGTAPKKPISLGQHDGKKLFLRMIVKRMNGDCYQIDYCIYREE